MRLHTRRFFGEDADMIPLLLLVFAMAVVFGIGFAARWLFVMAAILFMVWVMRSFIGRKRWSRW